MYRQGLYKHSMARKQPSELPRRSAPAEEGTARIILNMGGKRYEVAIKVQARELTESPSAPGIVIEMPATVELPEPE